MSKLTQRKQSLFDLGRQFAKAGYCRYDIGSCSSTAGYIFLAGFNQKYEKKEKNIINFIFKPKSQTQKNRDKAFRKRKIKYIELSKSNCGLKKAKALRAQIYIDKASATLEKRKYSKIPNTQTLIATGERYLYQKAK